MNIAVIFAGGSGKRMNTKSRPKQFLDLNGKPILIYTLEIFENHQDVDAIIVVCLESWIPYLRKMLRKIEVTKVVDVIPGGETGQESIYLGLCAAEGYVKEKSVNDAIVMIHDGVRPLVTEETVTANIQKVKECGSCITCVRATETFIVTQENGSLIIPERADSLIARAPQSFLLSDILKAHRMAISERRFNFIDSCTMMSHYGYKLGLIEGPMENIKITTPTDFFIFRAMVEVHENQQIFGF